MKQLGIKFKLEDPEDAENSSSPIPLKRVQENSHNKAMIIAQKYKKGLILAADTIVIIDGMIFEKPIDAEDAKLMLKKLSGRTHEVITGISIINAFTLKELYDFEVTRVTIKDLTESEIDSYILSSESMDKAGAYAAQNLGALLIEKIDGCYFNVVGLPISKLHNMLKKIGFNILLNNSKKTFNQ